MNSEQIEALCKQARHNIKIFINRAAKKQIAEMHQTWGRVEV